MTAQEYDKIIDLINLLESAVTAAHSGGKNE